jgi:hypothetical protein
MPGFTSHDDLINQISVNGRFWRTDWQKSSFTTTAQAAGLWYSLFRGGGNPPADTILGTGTNLAFQALTDATANATFRMVVTSAVVRGTSSYSTQRRRRQRVRSHHAC